MPYFDRFDIAEAHYMFLVLYHDGQGGKRYRRLSKFVGMRFKPRPRLTVETLTENGRLVFDALVEKSGEPAYQTDDPHPEEV